MGWACSAYGIRGQAYTEFWWGNVKERGYFEETGVGGRIILRWVT